MSEAETIGDIRTEVVNLRMTSRPPEDYHCSCRFCAGGFKGVLIRKSGVPYSRLDRRRYYSPQENLKVTKEAALSQGRKVKQEGGHVGRTPLHVARWAVQSFSKPEGWVLDPTMGAGTTAVEALNHGRNVFGVEIEEKSIELIGANVAMNNPMGMKFHVAHGDAREIEAHLGALPAGVSFDVVINNPPYSGDERAHTEPGLGEDPRDADGRSKKMFTVGYDRSLPNLAFLKEGAEYWETMRAIYGSCARRLKPGGRFVIGVKDQMRAKKPDELHRRFAEVLETIPGLSFEGVVVLPHHPRTLFMNTYERFHGAKPPLYQSVVVFRKEGRS